MECTNWICFIIFNASSSIRSSGGGDGVHAVAALDHPHISTRFLRCAQRSFIPPLLARMLFKLANFFQLVQFCSVALNSVNAAALIPAKDRLRVRSAASSDSYGGYNFNADASNNVAVYFGQTVATGRTSLASVCQDPSVDIVILGFITVFFGPGGYPSVNFGAACSGKTAQMQARAPGLLSCPELASQIATCQTSGKKVLLSLGGWLSQTVLRSDVEATELATTLWNVFGAGTAIDPGLRPFGTVKIDGFDIDNENKQPAHYTTFATALRTHYAQDPSKQYYISAAPQCVRPDASIPLATLQNADFVFVQFYNNPSCNIDSAGFDASLAAWSVDLAATGRPRPKLFIGAPSFREGGTGYLPPGSLQKS